MKHYIEEVCLEVERVLKKMELDSYVSINSVSDTEVTLVCELPRAKAFILMVLHPIELPDRNYCQAKIYKYSVSFSDILVERYTDSRLWKGNIHDAFILALRGLFLQPIAIETMLAEGYELDRDESSREKSVYTHYRAGITDKVTITWMIDDPKKDLDIFALPLNVTVTHQNHYSGDETYAPDTLTTHQNWPVAMEFFIEILDRYRRNSLREE